MRAVGEGYGLAGPRRDREAADRPPPRRAARRATGPRLRPRSRPSDGRRRRRRSPRARSRTALGDGRITFHLQPAVDVATGQVDRRRRGAALARAGAGRVSPTRFLPVLARERPARRAVGGAAWQAACADLGRLRRAPGSTSPSRSTSRPRACSDPGWPTRAAAARAAGVDPARVTFELDERAFRAAPAPPSACSPACGSRASACRSPASAPGHAPSSSCARVPLTEVKLGAVLVTGAAGDPAAGAGARGGDRGRPRARRHRRRRRLRQRGRPAPAPLARLRPGAGRLRRRRHARRRAARAGWRAGIRTGSASAGAG